MTIKAEMHTIETWELAFLLKEMLIDWYKMKARRQYWTIDEQEQWRRLDSEVRAVKKELRSRSLAAQYRLPGF